MRIVSLYVLQLIYTEGFSQQHPKHTKQYKLAGKFITDILTSPGPSHLCINEMNEDLIMKLKGEKYLEIKGMIHCLQFF